MGAMTEGKCCGVEFKGEDKGFCRDIESWMAVARWVQKKGGASSGV